MSIYSLERSLRQLAIKPSTLCYSCRRTAVTSAAKRQQQQSPTSNLYQSFQDSLNRSGVKSSSPGRAPTATATIDRQTPQQAGERDAYAIAMESVREAGRRPNASKRAQELADLERTYSRDDLDRQVHRKWRSGDVYAPHDLSGIEMAKWQKSRQKPRPKFDSLDLLGMNPLDYYKNFSIMSEYMTETGRIKHSKDTGLRPVNQRRMAKAIRRAVGMGLIPSTHKHPELIKLERRF